MQGVFLDASVLRNNEIEDVVRFNIQHNNIRFEFPEGFTQLRLIEECRALNCLDIEDPDNFDMIYDITMQMLVGKSVFIYFIDEKESSIGFIANKCQKKDENGLFYLAINGKKYPLLEGKDWLGMINDVKGFNETLQRSIMHNYDTYPALVGSGGDFFQAQKYMYIFAIAVKSNIIWCHFHALFIEIKAKMELLKKKIIKININLIMMLLL